MVVSLILIGIGTIPLLFVAYWKGMEAGEKHDCPWCDGEDGGLI